MDSEHHPKERVADKSDLQKTIVAKTRAGSVHRIDFLRLVNAMPAIITSDPSRAESMSFWASHSSPCPPSHSTPFPGAIISATMLSRISKKPLIARMIAGGSQKLQPRRIPPKRSNSSRTGNARKKPNPQESHRAGGFGSVFGIHKTRTVAPDRKSTRLNSSHVEISYAVFCVT